ncbi:MAG: hypothetical protein ACM3JD_00070 [Rudaea sp.]
MSRYLQPPDPYPPAGPRRGRDRSLSNPTPSTIPEPAGSPRAAQPTLPLAPANPARRRGPRLFILGALVAVALALLIPAALGVYVGLQERSAYLERQAQAHFQQALAYEAENYAELAMAELQIAVKFDPNYGPALDKLEELKSQNSPNGTPTPAGAAIADQLWKRAQGAIAQQQWSDAIDYLEEIERADANYRPGEVKPLLVKAYLNGGKQSVTMGQIDQARSRFEALLALDPKNVEAQPLFDRSVLYLNGTQAVSTNPPSAVVSLQQLYQQDPKFYDVKEQLFDALIVYGDTAMRQGSYCVAAREYGQAMNLGESSDLSAKVQQANTSCKQAVLATPTPSVTPAGPGIPGASGPVNLGAFTVQARADSGRACEGLGSIDGSVRDAQGNALAGYKIKIYNDADYQPSPFTPESDGRYSIVLGANQGLFHLVVLRNGQPASAVYDVNYPGGRGTGCHLILDWTKNP